MKRQPPDFKAPKGRSAWQERLEENRRGDSFRDRLIGACAPLGGLCRPEAPGQGLDGRHVGCEALEEDVVVVGVGDFEQGLMAGGGIVQG
jgi:hypothetical protein